MIARARGRREWKLLSNGYRASVWDDDKIREVDGGAWLHNMNVLNAIELYT